MARQVRAAGGWPPKLAKFDPDDWPPPPGAVLESCRCVHCVERSGSPKLDDGTNVGAARRRWWQARLDFLGKGTREYQHELFRQIREQSRGGS